jgi:hypothetical protein
MPKKAKKHLIMFLSVTTTDLVAMLELERAQLLISLVGDSDSYKSFGYLVSAIYFAVAVWFCWRIYTGLFRDGDFWLD